jgi:hypothetical protein
MIYIAGPATAAGLVANAISKARTARSIRRSPGRSGLQSSSSSSRSRRHPEPRRAGDARLDPRGRRARLLRSRTRSARRSTTRTRRRVRVGDGEAETGPLATRWHSNKFLNPRATARAADPAPERLQDRQPDVLAAHPRRSSRSSSTGYGWSPRSSRATIRRDVHRRWPRPSTRPRADPRDQARGPATRVPTAALADDRAATAEGLDGPEGRRRAAGRGHVRAHQVPLADRDEAGAPAQLEAWLRATGPRSSSTRAAA